MIGGSAILFLDFLVMFFYVPDTLPYFKKVKSVLMEIVIVMIKLASSG